jgi:hypothetical protein
VGREPLPGFDADEAVRLVKRAVDAQRELFAALEVAAADYASADGLPSDEVWRRVVRLAERWREAESKGATLGVAAALSRFEDAFALLGAIQDSWVLSLSHEPALRGLVLGADEVGRRMRAVRRARLLYRFRRSSWREPRRRRRWWRRASAAGRARFEELSDLVMEAHAGNVALYGELRPGERELTSEEASAVRERVEATAHAARAIDRERKLVRALAHRRDLQADLEMLRATQQGFVLSLAKDPARRAKAIPAEELAWFWKPLYERWKADTQTA